MMRAGAISIGAVLTLLATASEAANVSYYLNQTNIDAGSLVDGTSFALLTINDDTPSTLTFTLNPLAPLTSLAGSGFGISEFAFNVIGANPLADSGAIAGQWTLPAQWSANVAPPPNQADGFGRFEVAVTGGGSNTRASPLIFSINNTGLTLASFAEASSNNSGQGNVYFSAHIAGFDGAGTTTSGYFGGSTLAPVPLPAAAWLLLSGLGLIGPVLSRSSSRKVS